MGVSFPNLSKTMAFNCPHCGTHAQHFISLINSPISAKGNHIMYDNKLMYSYLCLACEKPSFWIGEYAENMNNMIFTHVNNFPPPNDDMPDNIKEIYNEAASITNKSPRAAAALIRLALQELCQHLKCKGKTLQQNIDFLVKERILLPHTEKAMDIVRIVGNEAVHPGIINLQDNDELVASMFKFINFIVKQTISETVEMDSIHDNLPDSKKRKGNQ